MVRGNSRHSRRLFYALRYNSPMRYRSAYLDRPPRRRWPLWLALAAGGVLAGLALMTVLALPKLTAFAPAFGAQNVSPHAPLRLTFNRPMNVESLSSALHVEPPLVGALRAEGNQIIYTPAEPWPERTTISVTLSGGRSTAGLPLLGAQRWTFTVAGQRLTFLKGGAPNVWLIGLEEGAEAEQLTDEPLGVYNYDISRDGLRVAYSALRPDGGADLRMIGLDGSGTVEVLPCPEAACLSPAFSPDGTRLAYERQTVITDTTGDASFGESHVHLYTFSTRSDEAQPDTIHDTRFPRWSPDGRLSYFDTELRAVVVRDLGNGAVTYIPNGTGDLGSWSPDGRFIVYPELFVPDTEASLPGEDFVDHFYSRLLRVEVATNASENLSGADLVTDAAPVYSPSGEWIVFGRRSMAPEQWTMGRQAWLMRADGSDARALTAEPVYNHSAFVWSADERALFYMRYNAGDPVAPVEIWTMNRDGTQARVITTGYLPEWVP